jgi:hypothetical protein
VTTVVEPRVQQAPSRGRVPVQRVAAQTIAEGRRERREVLALFLVAWAAYSAIGYHYIVQHHVFTVDAASRYAHAFFVWHNDPPKLAAVGFIWAPISTLIFLPAAAIRSLSTGMAGLPITTAAFGAGLLVVLYRMFRALEMPKVQALTLVLAFGANPMIVYYSVNGMSEIPYLFFLTFGLFEFVLWFLRREPRYLIVCGIMLSLGLLTRYEVLMWAVILVPIMTVAMIRQRVSRDYLEGALIAFLAPIAYGFGMWLFLNWLIQGNALYWLGSQSGKLTAAQIAQLKGEQVPWTQVQIVEKVLSVYWHLYPPTLIVLGVMVVVFVARKGRDLMLPALGAMLLVNVAFIVALISKSHFPGMTQLRYNMRDMPLTLIAVGWLYLVARTAWRRRAIWAVTLVATVVSIPTTWHTMKTFKYQFLEQAFVRSVEQDKTQEGTKSIGWVLHKGAYYSVGIDDSNAMGKYILGLHLKKNQILTDDAQTFWVMLASGRPDLFLDRIDQGDAHWLDVMQAPRGRVKYFLVTRQSDDIINNHFANITQGGVPWAKLVHTDGRFYLLRIVKPTSPT